jgi:hypothetical protein
LLALHRSHINWFTLYNWFFLHYWFFLHRGRSHILWLYQGRAASGAKRTAIGIRVSAISAIYHSLFF